MDARPLALAAGVALAAWLFVSLQRDLARLGAGWEARALAAAAYTAMALTWAAVLTARAPMWLAWLATAGALVVTVAPRALLRVPHLESVGVRFPALGPRGTRPVHGRARENRLAAEIGAIRMSMSTLTTSRHERAELRAKVERLERWRTNADPAARELVDLVRVAVYDVLDDADSGVPVEDGARNRDDRSGTRGEAARQRERRIRELLSRLPR
jgi:hypothetical protein